MKDLFRDIPDASHWEIIKSIDAGWSQDQKYFVRSKQGEAFLLRITDAASDTEDRLEYIAMRQLSSIDIPVAKLLDSGYCNGGKSIYRIFSWIEGSDARDRIPHLSGQLQYDLGVQAGQILRKIHQIPCPNDQPSWNTRFNQKIEQKIKSYHACGIRLKGAHHFIDYLHSHKHLLEDRPQSFQHGDYHIGNMVLSQNGTLGVIDFNRLDFGDPWEEFNRIIWCATLSQQFATGRIHGYFSEGVPPDFFQLMALYIACNQIGSISWAIPFGQSQIETLLAQTQEVLDWYDHFRCDVPAWYFSPKDIQ